MRLHRMALLLVALACSSSTGPCAVETKTVDAIHNDPYYNINVAIVRGYEDQGYTCNKTTLYSGSTAYGDRYSCTRCAP